MSQSRVGSALEAVANVAIGYSINFTANLLIFPWFGLHISVRDNLLMGVIYTGISLTRGYVLRRTFNRWARR